ncbi:MAG: GNAT family N-acetyltransferase [Treponema sp.]|nr:GNAT family N-acetyltransferase [Treponema sp.]
MNIRILLPGDYHKVFGLWTATAGMGIRSLDDSEAGIKKFLERNPNTCFLAEVSKSAEVSKIAEAAGTEVAGVILSGHDGRRGYIYHAVVKEEYRGKGIGGDLTKAVEQAMKKEGINKLALVVYTNNKNGNGFWEHSGYITRPDLVYRNKSINSENN